MLSLLTHICVTQPQWVKASHHWGHQMLIGDLDIWERPLNSLTHPKGYQTGHIFTEGWQCDNVSSEDKAVVLTTFSSQQSVHFSFIYFLYVTMSPGKMKQLPWLHFNLTHVYVSHSCISHSHISHSYISHSHISYMCFVTMSPGKIQAIALNPFPSQPCVCFSFIHFTFAHFSFIHFLHFLYVYCSFVHFLYVWCRVLCVYRAILPLVFRKHKETK